MTPGIKIRARVRTYACLGEREEREERGEENKTKRLVSGLVVSLQVLFVHR
jgi:hypothetical protein